MASRSAQPKSVTAIKGKVYSRLLRNGSRHAIDSKDMQKAVGVLQEIGLAFFKSTEYVKCANPRDADFRYAHDRSCRGRIEIPQNLDEARGDYECPECSRKIFPVRHRKAQFHELTAKILPEGISNHVEILLNRTGLEWKKKDSFFWRCDTEKGEACLIVVDYCDPRYLSEPWAASNHALYIVVDAAACEQRFLSCEWLGWTTIADILCGKKNLSKILLQAAKADTSSRTQATVSIYNAHRQPIVEPKKDNARKKTPKRAERATAIEKLEKTMIEHLIAARDHACALIDKGEAPQLLPRPTQKFLSKKLGLSESTVSKCIKDPRAHALKILWTTANDLEQVIKYR
jgi:hypothetical protein